MIVGDDCTCSLFHPTHLSRVLLGMAIFLLRQMNMVANQMVSTFNQWFQRWFLLFSQRFQRSTQVDVQSYQICGFHDGFTMVSRKLYVYFLFDEVDEHGSVKFSTNLMGSGKFLLLKTDTITIIMKAPFFWEYCYFYSLQYLSPKNSTTIAGSIQCIITSCMITF